MKKLTKLITLSAILASPSLFAGVACNTDAWDFTSTGTDTVVANDNNPISGDCSLEVPVTTGKRYVEDQMDQELSFRGTIQIDPNTIDIPTSGNGRKIKIHNVQCVGGCSADGTVDWAQAKMRRNADGFKIGFWAKEADGTKRSVTVDLNDGCNTLEYQLIAGNPGTFNVWINNPVEGSPDFSVTDADFSGRYTDRVRVGRMGQGVNINANTTGESYYLDTFESRRQNFIGNSCAP